MEIGAEPAAVGSADGPCRDASPGWCCGGCGRWRRWCRRGRIRGAVDGGRAWSETHRGGCVERNPWITDVTAEDLIAQYEFGVLIRDKVNEANLAVIEIRRVKAELEERLAASEDEGLGEAGERLGEAGERLRVAASEVEGDIYQVRNRSNQDPLNFPIKVNNRLANLLSMSERGDGRPGSGMYAVFEIMVERLGALIARLEGVWERELEAVNVRLRAMGMEEIVVEPRRVAMGDWMGDPDVTLGWVWGWWITLPTLDVTLEFSRTGCCEGASENHALPGHRRKTRT